MSDDGLNYCPYCGKSFTDDSEIDVSEKKEEAKEAEEKKSGDGTPEPINMFRENYGMPYYSAETVPQKRPKIVEITSSLSHAILYVLLFLIMQTIAASIFSSIVMVDATTEYMTKYYVDNGIDYASLSDEEFNAIVNKLTDELSVIMFDAVNEIDFNAVSVTSAVLTVLALFIIAKVKKRSFGNHVNLRFNTLSKWHAWLVIPSGIAMQFIVIFILNVLPFSEEVLKSYEELYAYMGESPLWLEILAVVIGAPIVEEFIFRSCVYGRLRRSMSPMLSALISAFLFGIAHGHPIAVAYAFMLGLILSYLYERYDSVIVPIIFHAAFNASNYLPLLGENSTYLELIAVVAVSVLIVGVSMAVINVKTKKSTNTDINENDI